MPSLNPSRPLRACFLVAVALGVAGCGGFNLDPGPGASVPKADPRLTAPPPGLLNGTSR